LSNLLLIIFFSLFKPLRHEFDRIFTVLYHALNIFVRVSLAHHKQIIFVPHPLKLHVTSIALRMNLLFIKEYRISSPRYEVTCLKFPQLIPPPACTTFAIRCGASRSKTIPQANISGKSGPEPLDPISLRVLLLRLSRSVFLLLWHLPHPTITSFPHLSNAAITFPRFRNFCVAFTTPTFSI